MNTKRNKKVEIPAKLAREADRLGVDVVWLANRILEREAVKIEQSQGVVVRSLG